MIRLMTIGGVRGMRGGRLLATGLTVTVLLGATMARAGVLVTDTAGNLVANSGYEGESVTTPVGGPFDNITFNFYDRNGNPIAPGTLYIFTSAYTGTPTGLSSSSFLAASVSNSGGFFAFGSSFQLQGGTQYFFYDDTAALIMGDSVSTYSGGNQYFISLAGSSFASLPRADANFTLSGSLVAAAPEPASIALLGAGFAGIGAVRRRRRS